MLKSVMGRLASLTGQSVMEEIPVPPDPLSFDGGKNGWFGFLSFAGVHYLEDVIYIRRVLFWIAAVFIILLIAAITNPTEASFRSHLTEMSFRRHLADIRQDDSESNQSSTPANTATSPLSIEDTTPNETVSNGCDTPPIAPFRFANHVAISLKTPPLYYKTLFFLSIALTSPLSPPSYLTDPTPLNKKHSTLPPRDRNVLYVGYLGHWVLVGQIPRKVEWVWRLFGDSSREKGRKKNALLDRPGITELRSIATKEDNGVKAITGIPSLTTSKHSRKPDSIGNTNEHLGTLPLHSHPAPIPVAPFVPESRRASIVNLVSQPTNPAEDTASSPLLIALKTDLAAAQAALAEVKAQLASHEESVSSGNLNLQNSLDEVRNRRKEDDADRQELKSRTKSLEEQKRQAEGARREAEKKLKAIESVRDGLQAKISAALGEIGDLKGLMESSVKNLRTIQEQGARFVIETRDLTETKKEELDEVENDIGELDARNEELLRAIKEAEEKVETAIKAGEETRKIGPEEEMMMMAAAYEAAAQEGYNAQSQSQQGFRERGGDQWAHQAAQYMAEAGMPYIDHQNYTARPSHSTSFGQFAKPPRSEEKRAADLIGFEDFGPTGRTTTPPASDSGSDVWGHDPGSPNGGISSSFSQNLLPQGLFRSLEGDGTPLDAVTDIDEESVSGLPQGIEPMETFEHEDGSGSESSGEPEHTNQAHPWKSPLAPNTLYGPSTSERQLLPPSSRTPPANTNNSAPVLPGLPIPMAGSRRWFSATSSSEHVNVFGISPSNDSLLGNLENNPFAPTSSEKQQLAAKWGTLGRKWGRQDPPSPNRNANPQSNGWLSIGKRDEGVDIPLNRQRLGTREDEKPTVGSGSSEKKPFRFFSLRRPTSSGGSADRSGTSPARD